MICSSFENVNRFPSLDFLGIFYVREKAFHFIFSTLAHPQIRSFVTENSLDVSTSPARRHFGFYDVLWFPLLFGGVREI